jgi:hypothetical protein
VKMLICCALLVTLLLALPCFATCSPKIPSTLPITSTFLSYEVNNNITDIQSDGLSGGTYYNGVDGVTTFLTCNGYNHQAFGDWQFDALSSTVRTLSISFANPIQVSAGGTAVPNPPFGIKRLIAHIEDKCTQIANATGGWNNMLQMGAGQSLQCPLIVHFYDSNAAEYRIYMGPNWEPETTYVQVTCNSVAADNSGCNDWFIDPIPLNGAPGQAEGRLVYFTKRSSINEGDYYFRLHFHLTRP